MKRFGYILLVLAFGLTACLPKTPTPQPVTPTVASDWGRQPVISAMQAGAEGNNNAEFIEIYNPTNAPFDLQGWSIWYQLNDTSEPQLVYRWRNHVTLPPHGYLLLVRSGQDFGVLADAEFDTALNLKYGGLQLRMRDGTPADSLGWGSKAPATFSEGNPAPAPANGQALLRLPGDENGSGRDTNMNAEDFSIQESHTPRNSASPLQPAFSPGLEVWLEAPATIQPGQTLTYKIFIKNVSQQTLENVRVQFPLPDNLDLLEAPGAQNENGLLRWTLATLEPNIRQEFDVTLQVPWRYFTIRTSGATAQADNWDGFAASAPAVTEIAGGAVPISVARGLLDAELTVEGVVTMYTGGYYAGGGNVKFYVQDETGGLQVQVFDGEGQVAVNIGDHVRVRGTMGVYRGAIQIVPQQVPDDVEILGTPATKIAPLSLPIAEINKEENEGLLIAAEGTISRVEEFSYNYEIDIADDTGNILTLYIDKLTGITIDEFQVGQKLHATGILEERDDQRKLYPRVQGDLRQVFDPGLRVQIKAPLAVQPGELFDVVLTVFNDYTTTKNNITLTLPIPEGITVEGIGSGGSQQSNALVWVIPSLDGNTSASVQATFRVDAASDAPIAFSGYSAAAAADGDAIFSGPVRYLFIGDSLPIWAIQGSGDRSPYVNETVTTRGIVTAIFPDLDGFWIQTPDADDSPFTSEGLFVAIPSGTPRIPVAQGDLVRLTGTVREIYEQTALELTTFGNLEILASGQELPESVLLDPPADETTAANYYEGLEGMLVRVEKAIAVSPTNRYGETTVVLPKYGVTHLIRSDQNGFAITFDDGSTDAYDYQETMPWVIMPGDEVNNITGPLAYTYGQYKIEPLTAPEVRPVEHSLPIVQPARSDQFSIMTWNAENFFDAQPPHPSSPPPPDSTTYKRWLRKAAATIAAAGNPTVVALQEVENISVLEDIAGQELLRGYEYQAYLLEGTDSRGIDVGYLVRTDQVTVVDVYQRNAPEGLTSRPPLVLHLQIGDRNVYVINNHFTSMSGGEAITEPRRLKQAEWNVQIMQEILESDPTAEIAIVGDLNSFYDSPPIQALRDAGLRPVFEKLLLEQRYTYIYQGEAQVLDYILVTDGLWNRLQRVEILHVNADWPPPSEDDTSPRRKSDHDPVIAIFKR